MSNIRLGDYYDIWCLAGQMCFGASTLGRALSETFRKRDIPLPGDIPTGLSAEFSEDPGKQAQWKALLRRGKLDAPAELKGVVERICEFLLPVVGRVRSGELNGARWGSGEGWEE